MTITPRRNQPLPRQPSKPDPLDLMTDGPSTPPPAERSPTDLRLRVTAIQLAHNSADAPEQVVARAQAYHDFLLGVESKYDPDGTMAHDFP